MFTTSFLILLAGFQGFRCFFIVYTLFTTPFFSYLTFYKSVF